MFNVEAPPGDPPNATKIPSDAQQGPPAGSESTSSQPGVEPPPSGIAPGAVAGISVGCAVVGALVGFIAAWFMLKRRGRRHQRTTRRIVSVAEPKGSSGAAYDTSTSVVQLSHFLLDATPDRDVAFEVSSLGDLIQRHVDTHYHLHHVQVDSLALSQAAGSLGLGQRGSLSAEEVASLALDPKTRQVALQHLLSFVLFTSIDVNARAMLTMLPAPVAAFLKSIAPVERGQANEEAFFLAIRQWRILSAFLLHPTRSNRTALNPARVPDQAEKLAKSLNGFLGAFVARDDASRPQQRGHLTEVIMQFTPLGGVLLSHPCDFRFSHHSRQKQGIVVVVTTAGLEKTTTKDGTPLGAPRQVFEPRLVQV